MRLSQMHAKIVVASPSIASMVVRVPLPKPPVLGVCVTPHPCSLYALVHTHVQNYSNNTYHIYLF